MYETSSSLSFEASAEPLLPLHIFWVASDYRGLKKHIATVREQQESDDRRYRSSLYLGPTTPAHVLWFPVTGELFFSLQRKPTHRRTFTVTGRHPREGMLRSSVTFPRRMKQARPSTKGATEVEKRQPTRPNPTHQPRNRSTTIISRLSVCLHNRKRCPFRCRRCIRSLTRSRWSFS